MPVKKKNEIRLSVAIPTYNGAKYIREALDSIISQLDEINEGIEIVISDNASTDQTPEIIREYQKKYSFIKYFRNNENLGPDSNFDLAVKRSTGEFVWLFSDDDQLKSGAIKKVLNVLKNYPELAAIIVNWGNYNYDSKECDNEQVVKIKEDMLFKTADDFLSNLNHSVAFVSSNIVRRSLWEKVHPEIYIGTYWIQYAVLLTIIRGYHSYFIAEPHVMHMHHGEYIRPGDSAEWSVKNTINLMEIFNNLREKGYSKRPVNKVKRNFLCLLPMEIIVYKKMGLTFKKSLIKDMVEQFKFYPSFWLINLPLLIIPNIFHRIIFKIYKLEPINKMYRGIKNKFFYSYFN